MAAKSPKAPVAPALSRLEQGEFKIEMNGRIFELAANIAVARACTRFYGKPEKAATAINDYDIDAFTVIVRAAMTTEDGALFPTDDALAEAIFKTGMNKLGSTVFALVCSVGEGGQVPKIMNDVVKAGNKARGASSGNGRAAAGN